MSTVNISILTFLKGANAPTDRYSYIEKGDERSLIVCKKGYHKAEQNLLNVFIAVNSVFEKNEIPSSKESDCHAAWIHVKDRFTRAKNKFEKTYHSIQQILIKLWHWITRQTTLERSYFLLSENIIKMSDYWKAFPRQGTDEEKRSYLHDLSYTQEFHIAILENIAKEEKPQLILEVINTYLNNIGQWEAFTYLLESGNLHLMSVRNEEVRKLLALAHNLLQKMSFNERDACFKRDWFIEPFLIYAIDNGDLSFLKSLEQAKPTYFESDLLGRILYRAVQANNAEITKWILRQKPGMMLDRNKNTPLHIAVKNYNAEVAKLLLDHGALKTIKNKQGQTPADLADTPDLLKLLHS